MRESRRRDYRNIPTNLALELLKLAREFDDREFLEDFYHNRFNSIRYNLDSIPLRLLKEVLWLAKEFDDSELLQKLHQLTGE